MPIDNRLEQNTDIKQLEAMKRPAEKDSDLYNNYLKAGAGNLKTTYGEAYFSNGQDQALQLGGYLKHFMQSGSLYKEIRQMNRQGIFAKSIGQTNSFTARSIIVTTAIIFTGLTRHNHHPCYLLINSTLVPLALKETW